MHFLVHSSISSANIFNMNSMASILMKGRNDGILRTNGAWEGWRFSSAASKSKDAIRVSRACPVKYNLCGLAVDCTDPSFREVLDKDVLLVWVDDCEVLNDCDVGFGGACLPFFFATIVQASEGLVLKKWGKVDGELDVL